MRPSCDVVSSTNTNRFVSHGHGRVILVCVYLYVSRIVVLSQRSQQRKKKEEETKEEKNRKEQNETNTNCDRIECVFLCVRIQSREVESTLNWCVCMSMYL